MQLATSASFAQLASQQAKADDNAKAGDGQIYGLIVKQCAAHASGQTHKCRAKHQ